MGNLSLKVYFFYRCLVHFETLSIRNKFGAGIQELFITGMTIYYLRGNVRQEFISKTKKLNHIMLDTDFSCATTRRKNIYIICFILLVTFDIYNNCFSFSFFFFFRFLRDLSCIVKFMLLYFLVKFLHVKQIKTFSVCNFLLIISEKQN